MKVNNRIRKINSGVLILSVSILLFSCAVSKKRVDSIQRFSEEQTELVLSGTATKPMRVFKINNYADSILLRTASRPVLVDASDSTLVLFTKRLYATVTDKNSLGVGIAAPQVGILKQIIWVQRFDKPEYPFEVYLNPKIVEYSEQKQSCLEGCLSIPGRRDTTTTRAETIRITYDKLDKSHLEEQVSGFTAVIFQHEIDHLNGILYLDHLKKELGK